MKYQDILNELKKKVYRPVYLLMGDESFFIDKITDYIAKNVLNDGEKEFNQTVVYGRDVTEADIISTAKRYPMMSTHQVVIVKEAQHLKKIDDLQHYIENPLESTILVLNYKYKKVDKRKAIYKAFEKKGVTLVSDKLREYQIGDWINAYVKEIGYKISIKGTVLLAEFLGTDLGRISGELEKLKILLPKGNEITDQIIQENIGVSKEYNVFELQNALGKRDVLRANKIIQYFEHNPKSAHITMIVSSLFGYFSKMMKYHFLPDKSKAAVASGLKINPFFVQDYAAAAKVYPPKKLAQIITILRKYDLKSKGVDNSSVPDSELLKELIWRIIH